MMIKERLFMFAQEKINVNPLPHSAASDDQINKAIAVTAQVTGAIALLIIIIAGLRYVTSQGNPQATAKAKNAIIYAGVGLAISLLAFSIVTFVVKGTT
ncbi:MAG TPA: hypothetical protein VJ843_05890 [Candidatus Saccharimonadales bacterium]|nr:hypothetical protein [Candidatus Saccharimonadales bacterium]